MAFVLALQSRQELLILESEWVEARVARMGKSKVQGAVRSSSSGCRVGPEQYKATLMRCSGQVRKCWVHLDLEPKELFLSREMTQPELWETGEVSLQDSYGGSSSSPTRKAAALHGQK